MGSSRGVILLAFVLGLGQAGCALGPRVLHCNQRDYNEAMKRNDEEELLLNLVRLRYNDDIGLLNTNAITAQYELQGQASAVPFFSLGAADRVITRILPAAGISGAERPTFSMAPVMDAGVYRRWLKTLDDTDLAGLTELSWPAATIFRLWFQYANGIPNAVAASGPSREVSSESDQFKAGMCLLQVMKDREWCAFSTEDKISVLGGPLPADSVTPAALLEAVRNGYEYRRQDDKTWVLAQTRKNLVLKISPEADAQPEVVQFREIFHLKRDVHTFPLQIVSAEPRSASPSTNRTTLNLVPRSGIQLYYYLAHGVCVPEKHLGSLAPATPGVTAGQVTEGLFCVQHVRQHCRPKNAHIAVKYHGYWFYIPEEDAASKSTFNLVLLVSRIEFGLNAGSKPPAGPMLTLPVGR